MYRNSPQRRGSDCTAKAVWGSGRLSEEKECFSQHSALKLMLFGLTWYHWGIMYTCFFCPVLKAWDLDRVPIDRGLSFLGAVGGFAKMAAWLSLCYYPSKPGLENSFLFIKSLDWRILKTHSHQTGLKIKWKKQQIEFYKSYESHTHCSFQQLWRAYCLPINKHTHIYIKPQRDIALKHVKSYP